MACIRQTPLDTSEVSQARGGERIYAGQTLLQRLNESAGINHPPNRHSSAAPSNSHLSKIRERPHLDVQSGQMDARQCTSVPSKCVSDAAHVVLSSAETKGSLQVAMERIMKNSIWSQSASLPLVHWHKRPQKQTQSPERMHSPRATAASGAKPLSAEGKFSINPNPHHSGLRIFVLVSNSILYGFILIEVLFEFNRICGQNQLCLWQFKSF